MSANLVSTSWKHAVCVLGAVMAIAVVLSLDSSALAQARRPSGAPSSVLPSGGGQALLDPSDTTILLLDHQAGLFQTVKDIGVAELRANTTLSRSSRRSTRFPSSRPRPSPPARMDR